MSYYKVTEVLPKHIIREIQKYVDGHSIYIPKKPDNKKNWAKIRKPYRFSKREMSRYILNIWRDILLLNFQKNIIW